MASGILTHDGDGVLCADNGSLGENGISDICFDLLDLLDGLLLVKAVKKQVDIGRRREGLYEL